MNLTTVEAKAFVPALLVEDVDAWHRHVLQSGVRERHAAGIAELQGQPWAVRDIVLVDPSGVQWRIAQNT